MTRGKMKNTLQARLITLMVMSSIFLIAAFTSIQLYNQLKRSAESNLYRANLGALVTKDKLERLFTSVSPEEPASFVTSGIRDVFLSELESKIIDNAVLLDKRGMPLISEGNIRTSLVYDKAFLKRISEARNKAKWLFPVIDKKTRIIDLFVIPENAYGYIVQLTFSLGSLSEAVNDVYAPVMSMTAIVIIANIILATLLSRAMVLPVKILNRATKSIAKGNLDGKISIQTKDELEELAGTFNYMTVELKRMKAKAENANPLTKLPGNIVIQEEVERRIKNKEKFILIYCDLDNFKAFNDRYGVQAGDNVIMFTAEIIKDSVVKEGKANDFIGHEGGDDFLVLTSPEKSEEITAYIIKEFNRRIVKFYPKEDAEKGFIEAVSRDSDKKVKFPIMTISLVGISNLKRKITSYSQLSHAAAEMKSAAKKYKKSIFMVDKRKEDLGIEYRREDG